MSFTLRLILSSLALLAFPAFAKGEKGGTPQTHQCMKDGQVLSKTKKECLKEGGSWASMKGAEAKGREDEGTSDGGHEREKRHDDKNRGDHGDKGHRDGGQGEQDSEEKGH